MINAIERDGWSQDYQWANIFTIDPTTVDKTLAIIALKHDGSLMFMDNNGKELKRE